MFISDFPEDFVEGFLQVSKPWRHVFRDHPMRGFLPSFHDKLVVFEMDQDALSSLLEFEVEAT